MNDFNKDLFLIFLKSARQELYVNGNCKLKQPKMQFFSGQTHDDGRSRLTLLQSGLDRTEYIEIGYRNKILVWCLNHHGHFLASSTSNFYRLIDMQRFLLGMLLFLKKAIGQPSAKHQVRGPKNFVDQTMAYECEQKSETFPITGSERIFYQGNLVYQAHFCAQWFINT